MLKCQNLTVFYHWASLRVIQRGGWLERNLRKDGASGATRGEEHLRPAEKQPQEKPAAEAAVWLQHWLSLVEEYERHISEPT